MISMLTNTSRIRKYCIIKLVCITQTSYAWTKFQRKIARFNTKMPWPVCINWLWHYQTPLPQLLIDIIFHFYLDTLFLRTHTEKKIKWYLSPDVFNSIMECDIKILYDMHGSMILIISRCFHCSSKMAHTHGKQHVATAVIPQCIKQHLH